MNVAPEMLEQCQIYLISASKSRKLLLYHCVDLYGHGNPPLYTSTEGSVQDDMTNNKSGNLRPCPMTRLHNSIAGQEYCSMILSLLILSLWVPIYVGFPQICHFVGPSGALSDPQVQKRREESYELFSKEPRIPQHSSPAGSQYAEGSAY